MHRRRTTWEIVASATDLTQLLTDFTSADGELSDEDWAAYQKKLDKLDKEIADKALAIRCVIDVKTSESTRHRELKARVDKAIKASNRDIERLKGLLKHLLEAHAEATGESRINTTDGSYVRINTRDKVGVRVTDWNAVPAEFVVDPEPRLDKVSLVKALMAGVEVPGIERTDTKTVFVSLGKAKAEEGE